MSGGPGTTDPGRVHWDHLTLINVLSIAFHVSVHSVDGPPWLYTAPYDINATMPGSTTKEQFQAMLHSMLEDRFSLKARQEKVDTPGFLLVVEGEVRLSEFHPKPAAEAEDAPDGFWSTMSAG